MHPLRLLLAGGLFWLCLMSAGCGGGVKPPAVFPVTGLVVYKGGKPMQEGAIQFQAQSEASGLTSLGEIGPDGAFTLYTLHQDQRLAGVPQGTYKATILSRAQNQEQDIYPLPQTFTVEGKENHFQIELDGPQKKR